MCLFYPLSPYLLLSLALLPLLPAHLIDITITTITTTLLKRPAPSVKKMFSYLFNSLLT